MKNVLVVGAGVAGQLFARDVINKSLDINLVGFVDDSCTLGSKVVGVRILGKLTDLKKVLELYKIDRLVIALPSLRGDVIRKVILLLFDHSQTEIFLIPRTSEIVLGGKVTYDDARQIVLSDLVGEGIIKKDQEIVAKELFGKEVLITGGGGSIGSELVRQVFLAKPKKLIVLDNNERNLFYINSDIASIRELNFETQVEFVLGDTRNIDLVKRLLSDNNIFTIFHAAAYKHVPMLEDNYYEAVSNNCIATFNLLKISAEFNIQKFVLISTDKAAAPVSLMGISKRIAEIMVTYINNKFKKSYTIVRFGNVFNSSGSAVEIFLKQIEKGGTISITNPKMTRFFLTIPEAAHLVLQAWHLGGKNKVYLLEMGEAVNIEDLAKCIMVIHKVSEEVKFKIIGDRKGEKVHEVLYDTTKEFKSNTKHPKIFSISAKNKLSLEKFEKLLTKLLSLSNSETVRNHSTKGHVELLRVTKSFLKLI